MKRLLRFLLILAALAGVAGVAVLVRRAWPRPAATTPAGAIPAEGPEAPLETPSDLLPEAEGPEAAPLEAPPEIPPDAEDLAEIWGIGPVFRGRLAHAGITSFASLAAASPAAVAAATGVPEERAAGWIAEAAARAHR
jgi:predicted flap endonuclease-1-like 5' DNA nuclease